MRAHSLITIFIAATAQALRFRNGIAPIVGARDINPIASLDPTRASVASVLRTAIPSSYQSSQLAGPKPTLSPGEDPPAWYLNLPAGVKSLLPVLYPVSEVREAGVVTSVASDTALSWTECSTTTITITLTRVPVAEETESTTTMTTTSTTTLTKILTKKPGTASSNSSESKISEAPYSSATTLTTTMTLTFTETSSSQATPLNSSGAPVPTRTSASLTNPAEEPTTATTTEAVYSTPPFPFSNATASVLVSETMAGIPSQTLESAPEQFSNAAIAGDAGLGVMTLMGVVGVFGLLF